MFRCTLQSTFEMYFNLAAASLQFVRVLPSLFPLPPLAVYIVNNIINVKSRGRAGRGEGSSSHTLCAMLIFLASNKVSWLFSAVNVQLSRYGDGESERGERGERREKGVLAPASSAYPPSPSLTCNSLLSASSAPTWYQSNALNQMFIFALAFPLLFLFSPPLSSSLFFFLLPACLLNFRALRFSWFL